MKIEFIRFKSMTIEEFAQQNNLIMEVVEIPSFYSFGMDSRSLEEISLDDPPNHITNPKLGMKYHARFKGAEIKEGIILIGAYGIGETPKAAIDDYRRIIAGKALVFNAYRDNRRTIIVPHLR